MHNIGILFRFHRQQRKRSSDRFYTQQHIHDSHACVLSLYVLIYPPCVKSTMHTISHWFMCTLSHPDLLFLWGDPSFCSQRGSLSPTANSSYVMTGTAEEMFHCESGWQTADLWTYANFYGIWNVPLWCLFFVFWLLFSGTTGRMQVFDYITGD